MDYTVEKLIEKLSAYPPKMIVIVADEYEAGFTYEIIKMCERPLPNAENSIGLHLLIE